MNPEDVVAYNRAAWDRQVAQGNPWTVPVTPEQVAAARRGEWGIYLTESKLAPRAWFPLTPDGRFLPDTHVLCLASGGGQQGPLLAAAGAIVTVFDNSGAQLARDTLVAERDGLAIVTLQGDMADLSACANETFDLIVHPVSNVFVPDVRPVWREAFRVLKPGGALLSGFMNPDLYIFDNREEDQGRLVVRFQLPYSDVDNLTEEERLKLYGPDMPLEWSHTLQEQIGGQLEVGFMLAGFYDDRNSQRASGSYLPTYFATRAVKL